MQEAISLTSIEYTVCCSPVSIWQTRSEERDTSEHILSACLNCSRADFADLSSLNAAGLSCFMRQWLRIIAGQLEWQSPKMDSRAGIVWMLLC